MNDRSLRQFPGAMRMHISLPVSDLEQSVSFYSTLLGVPPVKRVSDFAKFELAEPSLNLSLFRSAEVPRSRSHFGFEVKERARLRDEAGRLEDAGLTLRRQEAIDCCYAEQSKFWVDDPDGHAWEVFLVTADTEKVVRYPHAI